MSFPPFKICSGAQQHIQMVSFDITCQQSIYSYIPYIHVLFSIFAGNNIYFIIEMCQDCIDSFSIYLYRRFKGENTITSVCGLTLKRIYCVYALNFFQFIRFIYTNCAISSLSLYFLLVGTFVRTFVFHRRTVSVRHSTRALPPHVKRSVHVRSSASTAAFFTY